MKKLVQAGLMAVSLLSFSSAAQGANLFDLQISDGSMTVQRGFNQVSPAFDQLYFTSLQTALPTYTAASPLDITMGFRGLPLYISSPAGGAAPSPILRLQVPATGLDITFNGATRDESNSMLKDWFKKDGGAELDKLMRKLAELTPSDPLAGNPNSLMSRTVALSFERGFIRKASLFNAPEKATASNSVHPNLLSLGFDYMNLQQTSRNGQGSFDASSYTLPLGYAWVFTDPQHQLSFDLPVTYMDVQGAQAYSMNPSLSYSYPLTEDWIITPTVNYGAIFSTDMGSGGHVLNGSLTSAYTYAADSYTVHFGNMAGYVTTLPVTVGDYSSDPDIHEFTIKNGVMLYLPTTWLMRGTGIELFTLDTRFFGTNLFNDGYTEIGTSFGFTKRFKTSLRLGFSYILAKDNDGIKMNFGYTF